MARIFLNLPFWEPLLRASFCFHLLEVSSSCDTKFEKTN